ARAGQNRVVGVAMAPHYSNMSVGAYEKKLLQAADGRLDVALVRTWWQQPQFLDAVANRVVQALQRFPRPSQVQVVFTAHSLPERILASADPYADELSASAAEVARRARVSDWRFAYQSAGATAEPWLGPDVEEVLPGVAKAGHDGFLADEPELPELATELRIGDHVVSQQARGTAVWTGKALEPIEEGRAAQLLGIEASGAEVKAGFRSFANGMSEPVAA